MRIIPTLTTTLFFLWCFVLPVSTLGQPPSLGGLFDLDEPRGLRLKADGLGPGYVLFSPVLSGTTYLIDMDGQVVHTWKSDYAEASAAYLLDNGNLLRGGRDPDSSVSFDEPGQGGHIQEFSWEGNLVWDFSFNTETHLLHHDIEVLPSGNVLAISWELKSAEEARQAGRRPELISQQGLWPDMILEFQPEPPNGARIVWEWHAWDHLVQDFDPSANNYGNPAELPGRIDINRGRPPITFEPGTLNPNLMHTNAVEYNAELDQILLSVPNFSEIWIIDHSTTTEEASGHMGGRWNKGGDLLYRWGNPQNYGRGDQKTQLLGEQHDPRWIPEGFPGAGHILIFNNNDFGSWGLRTSVFEIIPPITDHGYILENGRSFGPDGPIWTYNTVDSFRAPFISGAHRIQNGNTFITSGPRGRFLEVTSAGEIVWDYWSPYSGDVHILNGSPPAAPIPMIYSVFRATKIPPNHPGLTGRELRPLERQPKVALPRIPE